MMQIKLFGGSAARPDHQNHGFLCHADSKKNLNQIASEHQRRAISQNIVCVSVCVCDVNNAGPGSAT